MKWNHWVALVGVLVGMVFFMTLASNFLPGWGKRSVPTAGPMARLTFADRVTNFPAPELQPVAPPDAAGAAALLASPQGPLLAASLLAPGDDKPEAPPPPWVECEIGQPQMHDFWFKNENAEALPVGVLNTTCQCTSVQLLMAPGDRTDVPPPAERERAAQKLEAADKPVVLKSKDQEGTATVPAGGVGVIRLTWSGDHLGPKSLAATLWMAEKGPGPTQVFEIRSNFIGPLKSVPTGEIDLPDLTAERLPRTVWIPCWSSTRKDFPLDAHAAFSRWKEEENPFFVGRPVRLTEEELDLLRQDPRDGKVLAGYKTPVVLLPHAPLTEAELAGFRKDPALRAALADYKAPADAAGVTTRPFDLGPFRRRVELKTEGGEPVMIVVAGALRGDLAPQDLNAVPMRFSKFNRTEEKQQPLVLESGADVTRLELDRDRTPDYLDVEFPKEPIRNGGRNVWTVQVKIVAGKAEGTFPRDEEGYRDSAAYVRPVGAKMDGAAPACLRIPVTGTADAP